jgi:peroxidase
VAHCPSFSYRVHNYTGVGDEDPSMEPEYAEGLNATCAPDNFASVVPLDTVTTNEFDLGYFQSVYAGKGLLGSDDALRHDSLTGAYVSLMNNASSLDTFFADFAVSMINMGRVGVLTGTDGEIRATCGIYVD